MDDELDPWQSVLNSDPTGKIEDLTGEAQPIDGPRIEEVDDDARARVSCNMHAGSDSRICEL